MSLIGKEAIDFKAKAVMPDDTICDEFHLRSQIEGKYGVLFFYPLDFTFVCPTELIAFHNRMDSFFEKGVSVIGVSVDSHFSHIAWRNLAIEKGGVGELKYPLVSDLSKSISRNYDVLIDDAVSLRATFIINSSFKVCCSIVHDLNVGRNVDEVLRMIDAFKYSEVHGDVCPAGWEKGKKAMKPTHESVSSYVAEHKSDL